MYEGRVKIDFVRVPMRDGVELCAKITRPDADGPFPAIMEYNPYRRLKKPLADYREEYPSVVPYLAENGYAIVQFEVRGTGNSGGFTTDIYSDAERQDAYEMVEWIAAQPWCTGNVGMFGKSYGAVVQWHVAVQNPPHLKAIAVCSANDDIYTEWVYPGGCLRPYMFDYYSPVMNAYNFAPPDPDVAGSEWSALWEERLERSAPWGIGYLTHPLHDDYWKDRSLSTDYDRVKCAVFVISGWSDCYPTALLRAYSRLSCPKKALIGPWGHWYAEEKVAVPGPRIDGRIVYRRWFDYWLKGIDNGVMDEPPVTLFVRRYSEPNARMPLEEPGEFRSEHEWPIARTEERAWHLDGEGRLAAEPRGGEARDAYRYHPGAGITSGIHWGGGILPWGMPIDQRMDDAFSLTYTTPPLAEDIEITGTPRAVLFVSSTADVAYFRVKLIDVAPDGTAKLVRYGGLSATHRGGHEKPEPLNPGEIYELEVPLETTSYVFEAGHRIRVAVASADFQNAWPTGKAAENAVHRGPAYPSRMILPVVGPQSPKLPEPDFKRLPSADPNVLVGPTEYSIDQDLAARTTTLRMAKQAAERDAVMSVRSNFTVCDDNPAHVTLKAAAVYTIERAEMKIEVRSNEVTTSDEEKFRHLVAVEIDVEGKRYFQKHWTVTVPRVLN